MTSFYDRYILPHMIDCACGMGDVMKQRSRLIPLARGRVLEVGIGTGLNLAFYNPAQVTHICGLDPAADMHRKGRERAAQISIPVEQVTLGAERIEADDASFDTVVSTFTLCTIPDAVSALKEMRRVLKPEGQLLFCEHGRAPDDSVRRWQDRLTPLWKPLAGGCHLNRDIPQLLRSGGFFVTEMQKQYLRGPKPMTYVYRGCARAEA